MFDYTKKVKKKIEGIKENMNIRHNNNYNNIFYVHKFFLFNDDEEKKKRNDDIKINIKLHNNTRKLSVSEENVELKPYIKQGERNETVVNLYEYFTGGVKRSIEKILINTKSFDFGCNIIIKIIEYCSYDKITLSIITTICEYLNSIFLKANKNVSNIKGVKIKVIASILLLFYKLLHSFGPHIICVKTINKYCLKFNEMMDKAVKTNFYSLYIEILTQVNIQEFHNSILNELSSQQRNYINKELQNKPKHTDNTTNATTLYKATYILKTNDRSLNISPF